MCSMLGLDTEAQQVRDRQATNRKSKHVQYQEQEEQEQQTTFCGRVGEGQDISRGQVMDRGTDEWMDSGERVR